MIALRKHYSGEGNTSRRIADAEKIRDNLYYKNERAMQFSAFLDKLQRMFNIFEEENEEVSEQAKVRMLLKKVERPQLQDAVGALRVRAAIEGISFTECANHLSAQVSELPDQHTPRKVSATGSRVGKKDSEIKGIRGGGQTGKRNGIHMPDGSIWTGFYSDWEQLSKEDRKTVMDTRISNKAKGGRGKPGRKVSEVGSANKLKEIKGQVAELMRTLASLKSSKDAGGTDKSTDNDSMPDNAGDSFGGCQQKRAKTKN